MNGTSQPVPPPPGMPPASPAKKGLSPLAWVLIGCGGLIVLAMIVIFGLAGGVAWFAKKQVDKLEKNPVLTAAEWAVRANPEYEVVSTDERANTLTIKNKKTGEVVTLSAEDAKEGNFGSLSIKTDDGTAVFDASAQEGTLKVTTDKGEVTTFGSANLKSLPAWLPVYPGGTVQGTLDTTPAEGRTAAFTVTTSDAPDKVLEFYETRLKDSGFRVEKTTLSSNDQATGGSLSASSEDNKRQANVIVANSAGQATQAMVTFQDKK